MCHSHKVEQSHKCWSLILFKQGILLWRIKSYLSIDYKDESNLNDTGHEVQLASQKAAFKRNWYWNHKTSLACFPLPVLSQLATSAWHGPNQPLSPSLCDLKTLKPIVFKEEASTLWLIISMYILAGQRGAHHWTLSTVWTKRDPVNLHAA